MTLMGCSIDGWVVQSLARRMEGVCEQFRVRHEDGQNAPEGLLTLYEADAEPDAQIYAVIKELSRLHTPEIVAAGRWQGRAYEVMEPLQGETLADLGIVLKDELGLRKVVAELGSALHEFSENGLRHRGLCPEVLLVRTREPLDLVISGFGSACLSKHDLEVVSTLNQSVYMAPEAVMGAVSPASDWWSLGVVLLEQVTQGACFEGRDALAAHRFLLRALTYGVDIAHVLDASLHELLTGLLTFDYEKRWQWAEVSAWLSETGEKVDVEALRRKTQRFGGGRVGLKRRAQEKQEGAEKDGGQGGKTRVPIALTSLVFDEPREFALAVATPEHWSQGLELLEQGAISTWIEALGGRKDKLKALQHISSAEDFEDDVRLMLTLKVLNPDMPLVYGGEIVTPLWLLAHPEKGYALMDSVAPFLDRLEGQDWFLHLHKRVKHIRKRAASLHIRLDEGKLRTYLLYTSHAQLAAHAHQHYLAYPDARSAGVLSLMERRSPTAEDLIVLLCAEAAQLVSAKEVLNEVETQMDECHLHFEPELAQDHIRQPRTELYKMLDERAEGMAVTGHAQIDAWIEQYRLEKRMPMVRLLVLLLYPKEQWLLPQKHQYITSLLGFFEKKVAFSGLIGPLVRMRIGRHTPRFDVTELKRAHVKVNELLGLVLSRKKTVTSFSFSSNDWDAYSRIDSLARDADLYKRDTGIDGLYMGFPFLLYQEPKSHRLPRIAPVFLWPMRLQKELGGSWSTSLAFDSAREEVRLNPALENILGKATAQEWGGILEELMRRSTLSVSDVMERLAEVGKVTSADEATPLPVEFEVPEGEPHIIPSAVLFMVNFTGQAVGEDLRALKGLPLAGSSLEKILRLDHETVADALTVLPPENERYLVANSDPSQESAVLRARESAGLLIEGPPGTGKSQTIVNLVADSIGRSENMLIVCQKKAALDVVHKRLVAEGLGSRIMMVNDVNADRDATIRNIREQLAQLGAQLWEMKSSAQNLQWERQKLGERITELESELDQYHEGLHKVDPQTGVTYRQIVSDLVRLEAERPALGLPAIRPLVGSLTQDTLSAVEKEVCAVLSLWLAARYEGSAFGHLWLFANDVTAAGVFKRALQAFTSAGDEVEQARRDKSAPVHVKSDPRVFRAWLQTHMDTFVMLTGEPKQQLIRWLPLFQTPLPAQSVNLMMRSVGGDLLEKFRHLLGTLKEVSIGHWQDSYSVMAARLDDATLRTLEKQASVLASPRPWYAFLTFWRGSYEKNVAEVLRAYGCEATELKDYRVLMDAVKLEQQLRPLRRELLHICETLKLHVPEQDSGPELMTYAQYCFNALLQVAEWVEVIGAFPDVPTLTAIIRSGDGGALQRLRMDYELAFMHYALRQKWLKALDELAPFFSDYLLEECRYAIGHGMNLPATVGRMTEELPRLSAYLIFRDQRAQLSPAGKELLSSLQEMRGVLEAVPEARLASEFARAMNREARLVWKGRMEQAYPTLLQNRAALEKNIAELEKADVHMRQLNRNLLAQSNLDKVASELAWEDITRLRGQRARRLREFIEQGEKLGLMKLRPIWLMNPDVASRLLPLKAGLFDTVVYDEASQISVEFALPTLFRGKRVVVSGDEKQMPPSSFFTAQVEMDEEDMLMADVVHGNIGDDDWDEAQGAWDKREIQDCPDLLQLARAVLPGTTLQIHYRSAYRELIAFSNAAFYASQLNVPVRHPEKEVFKAKPIELIQVNGVYHEQKNEDEAKRVIELLAELWKIPMSERPSVGVATFNKKQASLIEQMLYRRAQEDEAFRHELSQERQRFEAGEDMSVFVKNVENVQGDERDIIIFSTTFGYNRDGVFRRNFGVLGQQGGERRLNVGITRARKKVILVSSIPIEAVSDMLTTQRIPRVPRDYLQAYLEYARLLSSGEISAANHLLRRVALAYGSPKGADVHAEDGFLDAVEAYLVELGVTYRRASGEDAFYLDFVVEDPQTGHYVLGIECDAPSHPLLAKARARELWRAGVLKRVMPHICRVASPLWLQNSALEKERLKISIEGALRGDNAH